MVISLVDSPAEHLLTACGMEGILLIVAAQCSRSGAGFHVGSCLQLLCDAFQYLNNYCSASDKSYDRTGKLPMGLAGAAEYIPYY